MSNSSAGVVPCQCRDLQDAPLPSIAKGEYVGEVQVVGPVATANPAGLPAGEDDDVALGDDGEQTRVLIGNLCEVVLDDFAEFVGAARPGRVFQVVAEQRAERGLPSPRGETETDSHPAHRQDRPPDATGPVGSSTGAAQRSKIIE
jgi:hypothetical protein